MFDKISKILLMCIASTTLWFAPEKIKEPQVQETLGAPSVTYQRTLLPIDNFQDLGSTSNTWRNLFLNGGCTGCDSNWTMVNGALTPTTSVGIIVNASSSFSGAVRAGSVGIGAANTGAASLEITGTGQSAIFTRTAAGSSGAAISLQKKSTGGTAVANGDEVGNLNFSGFDGTSFMARGRVTGLVDGAVDDPTDSVPTAVIIRTGSNVAAAEHFRVSSAGTVGINTTTPSTTLSVQGNALISGTSTMGGLFVTGTIASQGTMRITTNDSPSITINTTGGLTTLDMSAAGGFGHRILWSGNGNYLSDSALVFTGTGHFITDDNFNLITSPDSFNWKTFNGGSTIMTLLSTGLGMGQLGINSTTPAKQLGVHGDAFINGSVTTSYIHATGTIASASNFVALSGSRVTSSFNSGFEVNAGTASRFQVYSSGNVEIRKPVVLNNAFDSVNGITNGANAPLMITPDPTYGGLNISEGLSDMVPPGGSGLHGLLQVETSVSTNFPIYVRNNQPSATDINTASGFSAAFFCIPRLDQGCGGAFFSSNNTNQNILNVYGNEYQDYNQSGTVTTSIGFFSYGAMGGSPSRNINVYDFYTNDFRFSNNGFITNRYGLYLGHTLAGGTGLADPHANQTAFKSYGVYQVDPFTQNYFAGNVGIASTTPSSTLSVSGNGMFLGGTTTTGRSYWENGIIVAASSSISGGLNVNGPLNASTSLLTPFVSTTSDTVTSTIALGGFTVGGNQFVVNNQGFPLIDSSHPSAGFVGIGTSTPSSIFSVTGGSPKVVIKNQSASQTGQVVFVDSNGGSNGTISVNASSGEIKFGGTATNFFTTLYSNNAEAVRIDTNDDFIVNFSNGTFNKGRFRVDPSGNVSASGTLLISSSTSGNFSVSTSGAVYMGGLQPNNAADLNLCWENNGNVGEVTQSATGCTISTKEAKHDFGVISNPLLAVMEMKPASWKYNKDNSVDIGFFAEDMLRIDPRLVVVENGKVKGLRPHQEIDAYLVGAIQEQQKEIESLGGKPMQTESKPMQIPGWIGIFGLLGLLGLRKKEARVTTLKK